MNSFFIILVFAIIILLAIVLSLVSTLKELREKLAVTEQRVNDLQNQLNVIDYDLNGKIKI